MQAFHQLEPQAQPKIKTNPPAQTSTTCSMTVMRSRSRIRRVPAKALEGKEPSRLAVAKSQSMSYH